MKNEFNGVRCPHCGAMCKTLADEDIFLCEYCGEKFVFDLSDPKTLKNKALTSELKNFFSEEKERFSADFAKYKWLMKYYLKKAYRKKFKTAVAVFTAIAVLAFLLSRSVPAVKVLFSVILALCVPLCAGMFFYFKAMYKKYHPAAMFFAQKAVECERQITFYNKLISKLTD